MGVHERLDLDHWLGVFSLERLIAEEKAWVEQCGSPFDPDWLPHADTLSSPVHLAQIEHTRRALPSRGIDLGRPVPVDVFLWRITKVSKGPITRIGGMPFRDPAKPWPTDKHGRLIPFLAQISFVDSKDLVPDDLPGDVLCFYAHRDSDIYIDTDSLVTEWVKLADVLEPDKFVYSPTPEWPFCAEGVIHRTVSYPDCDESVHEQRIAIPNQFQATLIGPDAVMIQDELPEDSTLVATLSSLQPAMQWPFINCDAVPTFTYPKGHEGDLQSLFSMMIGDMGSVSIIKDAEGQYRHDWSCY